MGVGWKGVEERDNQFKTLKTLRTNIFDYKKCGNFSNMSKIDIN